MRLPATRCAFAAVSGLCAVLLAAPACAQSSKPPTDPMFSSKTDKPDGSAAMTFGTNLPYYDSKVGVDMTTAAPPPMTYDLDRLGQSAPSSGAGSVWANMTMGGAPSAFGWDKTSFDARLNPAQDQGKVGATLSRSIPLGEHFSVTLQNNYAVTSSLAAQATSAITTTVPTTAASVATAPAQAWETGRTLRFNLLPTDTAFSAGEKLSSTNDRWLRSLSAEQKIYGHFNITGTVSETATGDIDKQIKAGFKTNW